MAFRYAMARKWVRATFLRMRGRWRQWWDHCPACNDDAPELDRCPVCESRAAFVRGYRSYPRPDDVLKARQWKRFEQYVIGR